MRVLDNNLADSGTLTTPDTISTGLITYPQDNLIGRVTTFTTNSASIVIDLGSAQNVTAIAIALHNLGPAATDSWGIEANATDSWGSPSYQSGTVRGWLGRVGIRYLDITYRYIRITLNASSAASIGRIYAGSWIAAPKLIDAGYNWSDIEGGVHTISPAGQVLWSSGARTRKGMASIGGADPEALQSFIDGLPTVPCFVDTSYSNTDRGVDHRAWGSIRNAAETEQPTTGTASMEVTTMLQPQRITDGPATEESRIVWMPLVDDLDIAWGFGDSTFTRAAPDASYIDAADGLLKYQTTNVPRFEANGFLVDGAGANLTPALNFRLSTSMIVRVGTSTIANDAVGIDGVSNSAVTVTDTDASAISSRSTPSVTIAADTTQYCFSIDVAKNQPNIQGVAAWIFGGTFVTASARIDSATGLLSADSASGSYVVESGDFWRVCIPLANNGTNTSCYIEFLPSIRATINGANDATLTTGAVCDWPQVESGLTKATSRILGGSTRALEPCSIPNANIPTLSAGATFVCDAAISTDVSAYRSVLDLLEGGAFCIIRTEINSGRVQGYIGGVGLFSTTGHDGAVHRYAIRTDGTTHDLLMDGVVIQTATGALGQPTLDMYLGSSGGTSQFINGHIKDFYIYDRALTNAELA